MCDKNNGAASGSLGNAGSIGAPTRIKDLYLGMDGKLRMKEQGYLSTPSVKMTKTEVQIGCTRVDRLAVEYLYKEFQKSFPAQEELILQ